MTTFLQGTTTTFQVLPNPSPLGWRSWLGAWYVEDSIKLRPNLTLRAGIRHEFTDGWNEASGRAANYVTDANGVLVTNPVVGNSVLQHEQREKVVWPQNRPGLGPVRQWKHRRPRRIRNLLFADRQPRVPAEFAAAL